MALVLLCAAACCCSIALPRVPDIHINAPTYEVGEMQEERESVPLGDEDAAAVEIRFRAGELSLSAGERDQLFSGEFRYNVAEWQPQVSYENGKLIAEQGDSGEDWGFPDGNAYNGWDLEFSPAVPLDVEIRAGAGEGELDFGGLQLTELDLEIGAGNLEVRFAEPNQADMSDLTLNAGASELNVSGIGNAGPERVTIRGGVGDITLDFTGDWQRSADVYITAGVGSLTLRLPDNVSVEVETEGGLSSVDAPEFHRSGDSYVNDAFGDAEIELHIRVTTGVGSVRLIEVSND
jgi:hypothetical protein